MKLETQLAVYDFLHTGLRYIATETTRYQNRMSRLGISDLVGTLPHQLVVACLVGTQRSTLSVPIVSIVVPFLGYPIGSLIYNRSNQKRNYNGDYR